ncbi:hypothetical protein L0P88_10130 [Muricauda sp. SCSIO 64092]|uniref:hypothetical protein n=1 Tax=Allomuricauda sp. SCSIO 64092 TaxID=2908842 RepID=UPI001FF66775|nr:hypothetical protein [Muricauda sp. SCSIO 64092]UOY08891.1 hypothetical protein L0P88_10130 [Muricauda sp. SCSIO 64092]
MQFAPAPGQVLPILEHNDKPAPRYRPKVDRVVRLRYNGFKSFDTKAKQSSDFAASSDCGKGKPTLKGIKRKTMEEAQNTPIPATIFRRKIDDNGLK